MSFPEHTTLYETYGQELKELLDIVLSGEVVLDRATAERLVRSLGALTRLHNQHRLNERGQCSVCWTVSRTLWRPWLKRSTCTVHNALWSYLRQPVPFVLPSLPTNPASGNGHEADPHSA